MNKKETRRQSLRAKMIGINVGITLASFLLCGVLFVISVGFLVGKYVNHDRDFFLTTLSDNLYTKYSFMEDTVYAVRDSEELMEYLTNPQNLTVEEDERLQQIFQKEVNISNSKNQGDGGVPLVDKVFLFDENGEFFSTFYYALVDAQILSSSHMMQQIFVEMQSDCEYREVGGRSYLAYTVLDDNMESCGVLIFDINKEALSQVMQGESAYKDLFWILYNEDGVIHGNYKDTMYSFIEANTTQNEYEPFSVGYKGMDYRLYKKELCLNTKLLIGTPENQAVQALYDSLSIYIFGIAIILLVGIISFVIFTYKMTKPIQEVTKKMSQVQKGNFETKLPDYDNQEFHEISTVFNEMTEYINRLIKEVYEKQISIKEMELKFLQTQMNPHFMFNVLNSIALQARLDGNDELFRMISSFSQLIQAKIYRNNEDKVKIEQELEYVEYYLYLQSIRFGERLQYKIQVEEERIRKMYIPKLCMQLIVENAVVHGIEPKLSEGLVSIHLYEKEESIYIDITDNGVGFEKEGEIALPIQQRTEGKAHNHVGLNNAHHIIQLMYGDKYGIQVYSKPLEGTKVRIHIPFDEEMREKINAV